MPLKTISFIICIHLLLPFNIRVIAQSSTEQSSDVKEKNQQPKLVMPPKHLEKSEIKIVDSIKQSITDSNNLLKPNNSINIDLTLQSDEDAQTERIIQDIIERKKDDFAEFEKLNFEKEHLLLSLSDTLNVIILRNKNQLLKTSESLENLLNDFGARYSDTLKREKARVETVEALRSFVKKEIQHKDSLVQLATLQKQKEKELTDVSKMLDKLNNQLKNQFDSINKLIQKTKETSLIHITYNKVPYRVLVVPTVSSAIKIHNNNRKSLQPLKFAVENSKEKPFAVLNAGMYESDGSALGLLVVNRKEFKKLDEAKTASKGNFYMQPNGVFHIDTSGRVFISKTDHYKKNIFPVQSKEVAYATQSGPMLMINGTSNPNFSRMSVNRNIRNGVGVVDQSDNKLALFIISDNSCTFYDMASLFRLLKCGNALYLDGAISKMYTEIRGKKTGNLAEGALGPLVSVSRKNQ